MKNAAIVTTIGEFIDNYSMERFTLECHRFVEEECGLTVGEENDRSWNDCYRFLAEHLPQEPKYMGFFLVFEYLMPESMKRSDVLLLTNNKVIILEFKQKSQIKKEDISQAAGYGRSIHNYHYVTGLRNMEVLPYMVYTRDVLEGRTDLVPVLQRKNFTDELTKLIEKESPMGTNECEEWLKSPYYPLKSLAESTLQLFRDGELPNIKRIREGDIQDSLNVINQVIDDSQYKKSIIFVTGVPGAGKTLVGLKTVYDYANAHSEMNPIYLSGNDPLVNILQNTLSANRLDRDGESFIQPMKAFKKMAYTDIVPLNRIVVFDEAQRAWDTDRRNKNETEATLLLSIGDRIAEKNGKVTIICLIGEGQAIHKHEETGMPIWSDALMNRDDWNVFIPQKLTGLFRSVPNCNVRRQLFLDTSIRNDFIDVSPWVEAILSLDLEKARRIYQDLLSQGFSCWVFNKKEQLPRCVEYVRTNYLNAHTGIIVSSHIGGDQTVLFGDQYLGNRVPLEQAYHWYTEESYKLTRGASEFLIQGIELEYPIVSFVGDYYIENGQWKVDPHATNPGLNDLRTVIENVYRVLLTRSRKGMFLYIPKIPKLMETYIWFMRMIKIDDLKEK